MILRRFSDDSPRRDRIEGDGMRNRRGLPKQHANGERARYPASDDARVSAGGTITELVPFLLEPGAYALAPAEHVHVTIAHGAITLTGTVQTITERIEAELAVERLRGVRDVRNRIEVRRSLESGAVKGAIESALARHTAREISHLRLTVEDGPVVVDGIVRSVAPPTSGNRGPTRGRRIPDRVRTDSKAAR